MFSGICKPLYKGGVINVSYLVNADNMGRLVDV